MTKNNIYYLERGFYDMKILLCVLVIINALLNIMVTTLSIALIEQIKALAQKITFKKAKTLLSYSEYSQLEHFFPYNQYKKLKLLLDKKDDPQDLEKFRNKFESYIKDKFYISILIPINFCSIILWIISLAGSNYFIDQHILIYVSLEIIMSVYLITTLFIFFKTDLNALDLNTIAYMSSTSFSSYPALLDLYKINKAIQYKNFQKTKALLIALDLFFKELESPNHQQEAKILISQALNDSKLNKKLSIAIKVLNDKNLRPNDEIIDETNDTLNYLNKSLKKIIDTVYIFMNNEYKQKQYKAIINNKVSDLDEDHLNEYYSKLFKESNKD